MVAPFVVFDITGSTSSVLLDWVARDAALPAGTVVVARAQRAARGSRGRAWQSLAGNFAASVLLRPGGEARDAGRLSLTAGVALLDALGSVPGMRLKWPNDLMVGQAKLAGILVEAVADGQRLAAVVVGVGVNLRAAPPVVGRETISLAALGIAPPEPMALAARLRDALGRWAGAPFEAVARTWLGHAGPLGAPISVTAGGRVRSGQFAGLSPDGHLLLREAGAVVRIGTGEVG